MRCIDRYLDHVRTCCYRYQWQRSPPQPSQITFYMQVYHDLSLATQALTSLRRHYSESRVIVISDGDSNAGYGRLQDRFGVEFEYGKRLYSVEHGGLMIHRMLDRFIDDPTPYLIKIDTDTLCHRRFRFLPTSDCCFGSLQAGRSSVQGGVHGFTQGAAEQMLESGWFLNPLLRDYRRTWADIRRVVSRKTLMYRAEVRRQIGFEWVIAYVARQLGIRLYHFPEVYSRWKEPPRCQPGEYAFTHPLMRKADTPPLFGIHGERVDEMTHVSYHR